MKKLWAGWEYITTTASDHTEGWTALEMTRRKGASVERVARVVFWDAEGQFSLEMLVRELPLVVVDELIAEARATVKFR